MQAAFTLSQACVCFDDGDHLEESKVMMTMMMMMVTWRKVMIRWIRITMNQPCRLKWYLDKN